ncbi:PP2C family protein-serine/threonine phosphatase [Streptomyces sp. AC558_RSS880]|uniref:PP2C family protein-serine/threonine phosphatase n=1 Tax=Streptomyces sp. AC558_RSS880 TaxID=2823687 RepID=UPI001C237FB8|nr:PP2C family protein-serine/threonine phosphatase [Streptomyces sp. AC558_RSS880]
MSDAERIFDMVPAGAVALYARRRLARQTDRLEAARAVVERVQRTLLPSPPRRIGDLELAARYEAAHGEARLGGDLYAVRVTRFGTRVLLGDVRGKGLDAVSTVSVLLGAFREAAERAPDLAALARRLDTALEREAPGREADVLETVFATALLLEFPADTHAMRLLNLGHPPPYLVRGIDTGTVGDTEPGLPLGLGHLYRGRPAVTEVAFERGSVLIMVTDGVTEARNRTGDFYDPQRHLPRLAPFPAAHTAAGAVLADVKRWADGPPADDRAILAVRRDTSGP